MREATKSNLLLLYLFISVIFMDTIFKHQTVYEFYVKDTLLSIIFLSTYILIIYFILSFFDGNRKFLLSILMLAFIAFVYTSQFIYYKFFKTFYSFYSIKNGLQVVDFWKDIVGYIASNLLWIIVLFSPVIILLIFGRSYFSYMMSSWMKRVVICISVAFLYLIGVGIVQIGGSQQHSAYDLYYNNNFPQLSVQKLGLLTTMRLDIQRSLTDWSPKLEDVSFIPSEPDFNNNSKETDSAKINGEGNSSENEEIEKEIEYNVLDINFDQLIEAEMNETVKEIHKYFATVEPTEKNEYTGKYEGYNLILLTAESFAPYAVHKELTPTLYKMIHEGYHFTNFYTPIWEVSTSDGEYVALQSLIPKSNVWSFKESSSNSLPFVLGHQLKNLGYKTNAYHNHTYTYYGRDQSHPNLGYDYKGLGNGLDVKETWPESDLEMMEKTVSEYIDDEPFHVYYMTVSGHMQYSFTGNYIAWKNKEKVEHLSYSDQAKAYIATHIELDRALEYLLNELEKKGIADQTLIALSSDHYPYGLDEETIDELVGHPVEENFELYKNNFIIYTKGMEPEIIDKPASSLDILPTLSNLLGIEYDSRLMMGKDIFSNADPVIPFLNKSFITEKGKYNSIVDQFTSFDGAEVDQDYVDYMASIVQAKFYFSTKILEADYYKHIVVE